MTEIKNEENARLESFNADSSTFLPVADVAPDDEEKDGENKSLSERPSITVRTRIILAFSLIFALCAIITFWSIYALSELQDKLYFLEVAGNYLAEIQQARRFEKNFLLYRTNAEDALEHIDRAQKIIRQDGKTINKILGPNGFQTMVRHLTDYHNLMLELTSNSDEDSVRGIEPRLRLHGAQMVSFSLDFVKRERDSVDKMLRFARRVPFFFLGALLVLMIFIASFLARQLLGTLARFMEYTRRIGNGDFSPITPQRKYRDEFSQLAMAFNRMIHELEKRHRILVESHKLRAIGTLVAGVAHELNNPLNNTMLTASMLEEDLETLSDKEKRTMITDIIKETERSQIIVRNLLDFARDGETKVKPLKLNEILNDSIRLVANQVRMAKVVLQTDYAEDLPTVHGDEQMLQQVFINLILNAVDVLHERGTITVSTMRSNETGFVAVEIADNGPGIPDHILPQIFDPFFTTKTKSKGTGLGLSVSLGIMRKLGGYIQVKTKVDMGTKFTVFIPITDVPSKILSG